MNKSLTIIRTSTVTASPLLKRERNYEQNELDGNPFTDTDDTLGTVIPVPAIVTDRPTNNLNERQTYSAASSSAASAQQHQITTVTSTIQQQHQLPSLQQIKNETKTIVALRNQLDLRASTKS